MRLLYRIYAGALLLSLVSLYCISQVSLHNGNRIIVDPKIIAVNTEFAPPDYCPAEEVGYVKGYDEIAAIGGPDKPRVEKLLSSRGIVAIVDDSGATDVVLVPKCRRCESIRIIFNESKRNSLAVYWGPNESQQPR